MPSRPTPTLADAMRMIASLAREMQDLQTRLTKLERSPRAKPDRMTPEAWLAQRRQLAAAAREARASKAAKKNRPAKKKGKRP